MRPLDVWRQARRGHWEGPTPSIKDSQFGGIRPRQRVSRCHGHIRRRAMKCRDVGSDVGAGIAEARSKNSRSSSMESLTRASWLEASRDV